MDGKEEMPRQLAWVHILLTAHLGLGASPEPLHALT